MNVYEANSIGKNRLDFIQSRKIAALMSEDEIAAFIADGKYITTWIYETLKTIFKRELAE